MEKIIEVPQSVTAAKPKKAFTVSDFSITELEDRLEMAGRCNGRCDGGKAQ